MTNEHYIKLTSRIPFPTALSYRQNIIVKIDDQEFPFTVVKIEGEDKQNDTIHLIYKCKYNPLQ